LLDEIGQAEEYFSNLAALGLMGYPSDISGESFDEIPEERIPSALYQSEIQLVGALIDFHTRYHGWRMFAEEEIGIPLNDLLQITMSEHNGGGRPVVRHGIPAVTEQLCENTLALNQQYLDSVPAVVDFRGEGDEELDLDARAQQFAEGMAEAVDYP
jgi:hypothetical protein